MFALYATLGGRMETRRGLEFELYGDGFDLFYDGGYVVGKDPFEEIPVPKCTFPNCGLRARPRTPAYAGLDG